MKRRRYRKHNPSGTTIALVTVGVAAAGVGLYYLMKPAEAATTPPPQPSPPPQAPQGCPQTPYKGVWVKVTDMTMRPCGIYRLTFNTLNVTGTPTGAVFLTNLNSWITSQKVLPTEYSALNLPKDWMSEDLTLPTRRRLGLTTPVGSQPFTVPPVANAMLWVLT